MTKVNIPKLKGFVFGLLLSAALLCGFSEADESIYNNLATCCKLGTKYSDDNSHCANYLQVEIDQIPAIWRGFCFSTISFCCSRSLESKHCLAGRKAAKSGSDCDGSATSNSTAFQNCCKACQIGLGVATNGNNCSLSVDLFQRDESYTTCCQEYVAQDERADTFVIAEGDDICSKVENLCQHICENTSESYVCKCRKGYQLDANRVTCSLITGETLSQEEDADEVEEEEDEDGACAKGYKRNTKTFKCEDIDECRFGLSDCSDEQYCLNTPGGFRCLNIKSTDCFAGYRFNAKKEECEDINECLEEIDDCKSQQVCINKRGSYICKDKPFVDCLNGFVFDPETKKCEDYDECLDNPCEENFECVNESGGYKCLPVSDKLSAVSCAPGFRNKHNKCIDIDECTHDKNACGEHQVCINEQGGYRCNCQVGFKMDDNSLNYCVDINECQINNHNCLPTQRCDNTVGSYTCTRLHGCGTGYTLNAQTGICDDDNECALGTHDCPIGYDCRNTEGSFRCDRRRYTSRPTTTTTTTRTTTARTTATTTTARPAHVSKQTYNSYHVDYSPPHRFAVSNTSCGRGFQRSALGACVDIDECSQQHACASHQRCINTNGSFKCVNLLECTGGYKSTPDGLSCVDIDECATGEHNCSPDQICRNRIGAFICSCPPGHMIGPGNSCVDINECEQSACPRYSKCINTPGSYYCECKSGFRKHAANDKHCVDVDECKEFPRMCEQNCINMWGSYRCSCRNGFKLASNNRSCVDIDECEVHKDYKPCMGYCVNTHGSYECRCPPGYELDSDKNTCRDIDECSNNICNGRHEICTNTRGSYRCTKITCPFGYANDVDQKNRCRLTNTICEDDEDCYNKVTAYTYNFITIVSKLPVKPKGITLFNLRGPVSWYEQIDFDLNIASVHASQNVSKATLEHFSLEKEKNRAQLNLMRTLEGPQDIELQLTMTVFSQGMPRGKSVVKIFVIVSQYNF